MARNVLFFVVLFLFYTLLMTISVALLSPLVQKFDRKKNITYRRGFKEGLGKVVKNRWKIVLFSLTAAAFILLPDLTVSWPVIWSFNQTGSVIVFVIGSSSILYER